MNNDASPLVIRIHAIGSSLNFLITNRKNQKKRQTSNKIGLVNAQRRLDLTYKNYQLNIENEETDFSVNLILDTLNLKKQ